MAGGIRLRLRGPALRLRGSSIRLRSYSPALQLRSPSIRLRRSGLFGTGHGGNDRYYHNASSGLHCANRGFAATIFLRPRILGRIRALARRVLVALTIKAGGFGKRAQRRPQCLRGDLGG